MDRTKHHQLTDILAITILAITILADLCGADSFTEIAQFGRAREGWLRTFLALPHGIPSHDTFTRVFARLDRHALAACLTPWAQTLAALALDKGGQAGGPAKAASVVAIDGKTARRSHDARAGQAALPTGSAWASEPQRVLGQGKTQAHSNEITALPDLLALLDLRGATVTIDAVGCHKQITTAIRSKAAPYVLALRTTQPWLHPRVAAFHDAASAQPQRSWRGVPHQSQTTGEKDHGRIETRRYTVVDATALLRERSGWEDLAPVGWEDLAPVGWEDLAPVGGGESERRLLWGPRKGTTPREVRNFISSLPPDVKPIAQAVRSHGGIENGCHWTLDVVSQEEQRRVRKDHGPANLATIRRWVLSILRPDTTHKHALKARRLNAAWDPDYLLKLLRFASPESRTDEMRSPCSTPGVTSDK